jgi:GNAT superfamily N-acetyltransferase
MPEGMPEGLERPHPLEVRRYEELELPQHLRWQAVSFMRVAWPWIEDGKPRHTYDPGLRPVHFVVADGELLVSYAATIAVTLEHAGETYAARGLGNVFTYPSSRGRGHGGRVVAAATADIRSCGVDVGALFCECELAGFYARHGWQAMDGAVTLTGPRHAPRVHNALRMMLFASERGRKAQLAFQTGALHVEHGW